MTIKGPRQAGKTTTVGQLIDQLLPESIRRHENGVFRPCDPEKILYLSMDNSRILPDPGMKLKKFLEAYQQSVLKKSIRGLNKDVHVFIDEVQKFPDWGRIIRDYLEVHPNIKFVVTGSVRDLIDEDVHLPESPEKHLVPTMGFSEYVRYKDKTEDLLEGETQDPFWKKTELRGLLESRLENGNKRELVEGLRSQHDLPGRTDIQMKSLKDTYMKKGGYPSVVGRDYADAYGILDSHIRSILREDISCTHGVEKTRSLFAVLNMCAHSSGQKLNVQEMADSTDINRDTVERYLRYLSGSFLIDTVPKYHGPGSESGGRDKVYIRDVGHLNTLRGTMSEDAAQVGKSLETVCLDILRRIQFASDSQGGTVSYWEGRGEVDFVVPGTQYTLPVETITGNPKDGDLRGVRAFLDDNEHADFGIVVNDAGVLEYEDDLVYIPSWLFLLMG